MSVITIIVGKAFSYSNGGIAYAKVSWTFFRYKVVEVLAGGGSSLVEWRLETGRTHQVVAI